MKNNLFFMSTLLFFSFIVMCFHVWGTEQESNLKKAIRYSKNHDEKDKEAYESYLKLYRFRLANGTSGTTAADIQDNINSCFLGQYESTDIKYLCSALAVDAQMKKFDLK